MTLKCLLPIYGSDIQKELNLIELDFLDSCPVRLLFWVPYEDGGEAAMQKLFGLKLEDLFQNFLGEI
ncbi:MAG: hypothetical protein ABF379_03195 [Akkermansiaceae bacterium]